MAVIIPVYGSEAARTATAGIRKIGEIHTVRTSERLFIKDVCVTPKFLGSVADMAARIALDTSQVKNCFPLDTCKQVDDGLTYICISNRGGLDADWVSIGDGGSPTPPDAIDVPYDPTASGLTATDVQTAIDELVTLIPVGSGTVDMRDVWLLG